MLQGRDETTDAWYAGKAFMSFHWVKTGSLRMLVHTPSLASATRHASPWVLNLTNRLASSLGLSRSHVTGLRASLLIFVTY